MGKERSLKGPLEMDLFEEEVIERSESITNLLTALEHFCSAVRRPRSRHICRGRKWCDGLKRRPVAHHRRRKRIG